jgi:hypothetical protein
MNISPFIILSGKFLTGKKISQANIDVSIKSEQKRRVRIRNPAGFTGVICRRWCGTKNPDALFLPVF